MFGKTLIELEAVCLAFDEKAYRARQMAEWIYKKHAVTLESMTTVSKNFRERLREAGIGIQTVSFSRERVSQDGTRKYLFPLAEGSAVEAAVIPDRERRTLCLSTQAGCKWNCRFCMTGKQGFDRDLTPAEIVNQYASLPDRDSISNIVFMGMGEPFDNTEAVLKSVNIFTADYGYAMSPSRITVSTVGILPGMRQYLRETRSHLAVSLHSPFSDERAELIPAEKKYPLSDMIALLREFPLTGQRRLTFEYLLIDGYNDSERHARALVRLLNPLRCRVNLIPLNNGSDTDLKPSPPERIRAFQKILMAKGRTATIRKSKGQDIWAACGMLRGLENDSISD